MNSNLNGGQGTLVFKLKKYKYNSILIPSGDIKSYIPNVHQQFKKMCHFVGQGRGKFSI